MKHGSAKHLLILVLAGLCCCATPGTAGSVTLELEEYLDGDDWFQSGLVLNSAGDYRGSIEAFGRSVSVAPANPLAWLNLGTARALNGDYEGAIRALERSVRMAPRLALGFSNLGEVYFRTGRFNDAVQAYTTLLGMWPQDANALFKLGLSYLNLDDSGKAQAEYLTLKLVDPVLAGKLLNAIQEWASHK